MLLYKSIVLTITDQGKASVKINNCNITESLILLNAGLGATIQKMIELNQQIIVPKGEKNEHKAR